MNRISTLKQYLLAIQTRNSPGDLVGSAELVNQVIDVFLYSVGAYILINSLQSSFNTISGVIAAWGGAATLVVSLASQGLVTQMFYGLFLSASNKFRKGDVVEFGDGRVAGYVASIGWTDTLVRGGDGVMASVPNRELGTFLSVLLSFLAAETSTNLTFADPMPFSTSYMLVQPTSQFATFHVFKCHQSGRNFSSSTPMPIGYHSSWKTSRMKSKMLAPN